MIVEKYVCYDVFTYTCQVNGTKVSCPQTILKYG